MEWLVSKTASTKKGNRPSYIWAAAHELANVP